MVLLMLGEGYLGQVLIQTQERPEMAGDQWVDQARSKKNSSPVQEGT